MTDLDGQVAFDGTHGFDGPKPLSRWRRFLNWLASLFGR